MRRLRKPAADSLPDMGEAVLRAREQRLKTKGTCDVALMEFDAPALDYLAGTKFSKGYRSEFAADRNHELIDRFSWLEEWAQGKMVFHAECCDYTPLIPKKQEKGVWLHGSVFTMSSPIMVNSLRAWLLKAMLKRFPALRQTPVMVADI